VVESGADSPLVTLAVEDGLVDEVLRRLLRVENHTIVYRRGEGTAEVIDRVVLRGGPGERSAPVADVTSLAPRPLPAQVPPAPAGGVAALAPSPAAAGDRAQDAGHAADRDGEAPKVGDLLRSHALAGLPQGEDQPAAAALPPAMGVEETLAATTRRAQQSLKTLVEGLQQATRTLQQQQQQPPAQGVVK
jgi:hypothetical protein